MSLRIAAALVLLIPACGEPLPLRVRDGGTSSAMAELPDVIVDACDLLGLECVATGERYGSITVDLVDLADDDEVRGRYLDRACSPSVWLEPDRPARVAHEIGHVLELDHVDDEANVMHLTAGGDDLTDGQRDDLERAADRLVACR